MKAEYRFLIGTSEDTLFLCSREKRKNERKEQKEKEKKNENRKQYTRKGIKWLRCTRIHPKGYNFIAITCFYTRLGV